MYIFLEKIKKRLHYYELFIKIIYSYGYLIVMIKTASVIQGGIYFENCLFLISFSLLT